MKWKCCVCLHRVQNTSYHVKRKKELGWFFFHLHLYYTVSDIGINKLNLVLDDLLMLRNSFWNITECRVRVFSTGPCDSSPSYCLTHGSEAGYSFLPHTDVTHVLYEVSCSISHNVCSLVGQNEILLKYSCNEKAWWRYVENRNRALDSGLLV